MQIVYYKYFQLNIINGLKTRNYKVIQGTLEYEIQYNGIEMCDYKLKYQIRVCYKITGTSNLNTGISIQKINNKNQQ